VKRLLLGKLADESERRSNIISSQIVFALNFFKGHAAGEAPDHDRHRNTRAANDGFPVADSRIDNDAVLGLHGDSNSTGFAQLFEISVSFGGIPPVLIEADNSAVDQVNGLIKGAPKGSKSSTLRVTTVNPRTNAVAAMSASSRWWSGRRCMSWAQRRKVAASAGSTP